MEINLGCFIAAMHGFAAAQWHRVETNVYVNDKVTITYSALSSVLRYRAIKLIRLKAFFHFHNRILSF